METLSAVEALRRGQYGRALEASRTDLAASPQSVPALLVLIRALLETGAHGEAEDTVRNFLSSNPKAADAWNAMGDVLVVRGRRADAEAAFSKAIADSEVFQRLDERVLVEFLQADEVDVGDHRPLFDDDDDHAVVDVDAHVLVQAGGEQRAQRRRALVVAVSVTDAKGQRGEHGAGVAALQAFDADVLEHEGLDGPGRPGLEGRGQRDAEEGGTKNGETHRAA